MDDVNLVRIMARGVYDLQKLRMQMGLRLCANFRAKLKPQVTSNPEDGSEPEDNSNPGRRSEPEGNSNPSHASAPENKSSPTVSSAPGTVRNPRARSEPVAPSNPSIDSEPEPSSTPDSSSEDPTEDDADNMLKQLRASYRRLTDGIARNRTLPSEKGFKGDELIGSLAELTLVHQYIAIEKEEEKQFRMMVPQLEKVPIYTEYLRDVLGVGPAMASVLIGWLDPHKARHISSFWRYCGLDVGPDMRGRSRRAEHLIEREYVDRNGEVKTRMSVTYDPFVKSKLMGVLAGSFLRTGSPWREVYDQYKHRLESDPARTKVSLVEYKRLIKKGEDVSRLWPPGRINDAAKRYMVKMFLAELWLTWRKLEGLPVSEPYSVAKQGRRPHAA